ncbi:MAG TPA: phosphotransferase [Clostridia bacterium]|nr:phosphotransferase [Clostridia bacterium]
MKPIEPGILAGLASQFGFAPEQLLPLGGGREDSDGVVFRIARPDGDRVFKVVETSAKDPDAVEKIEARAAFFAFLGEHGVDAVSPVRNAEGNFIECVGEGERQWIGYVYPYLTGVTPRPGQWSKAVLNAWGRLLGKTHRLTKAYTIWDGFDAKVSGKRLLTWQSEWSGFDGICRDEQVGRAWAGLRKRMEALPYTRDTAGFVHNDPHMENLLVEGDRIKLLDFDVASCHFFACDLAIAIQSVLFTQSGGMERPLTDRAALQSFVDALLAGYRQENDETGIAPEAVELFIAYRRILLFLVMQDFLNTKPEWRDAWKQRIVEEPRILTA